MLDPSCGDVQSSFAVPHPPCPVLDYRKSKSLYPLKRRLSPIPVTSDFPSRYGKVHLPPLSFLHPAVIIMPSTEVVLCSFQGQYSRPSLRTTGFPFAFHSSPSISCPHYAVAPSYNFRDNQGSSSSLSLFVPGLFSMLDSRSMPHHCHPEPLPPSGQAGGTHPTNPSSELLSGRINLLTARSILA